MPQPDHISALGITDPDRLDDDIKAVFAKATEKLGFVPHVLSAYTLRPQKLRNFMAMYNELMLAPSGLSNGHDAEPRLPQARPLAAPDDGRAASPHRRDARAGAARGDARDRRLGRRAEHVSRPAHGLHPPHLGLAADPGERSAGGARR